MLYTDEALWIVRYEAEADRLAVSPCILTSQRLPITAVGALLFAGHLALGSRSRPTNIHGNPGNIGQPGFNLPLLDSKVAPSPTPCQTSGDDASSGNGHSNSPPSGINAQLGFVLGHGSTGTVWECGLSDRPGRFAIKVFKEDDGGKMHHEASIYQTLASLQGRFIPELVACGIATNQPGDTFPFLLTSMHGTPLSRLNRLLTQDEEEAILDGLSAIHQSGVLHGWVLIKWPFRYCAQMTSCATSLTLPHVPA